MENELLNVSDMIEMLKCDNVIKNALMKSIFDGCDAIFLCIYINSHAADRC